MHRIDRALRGIEKASELPFAKTRHTAEKNISLVPCVSSRTNIEEHLDRNIRGTAENFAAIFHSSPAILCIIGLTDCRYVEMNKVYEEHTGYSRSEVIGKTGVKLGLWSSVKDRDRVFEKIHATGRYERRQTTFRTKAGELLNIVLSAERIEFGGRPCALLVAEDVTMRRQAEEARLELAQRLVNGQELECARVARELHDNIGQSLALFSIDLQETRMSLPGLSRANDARFDRLCSQVKDLGREIGSLSHHLHSSGLEYLGLATAANALCREFSERYRVDAHCDSSAVPHGLSPDSSLCFFRILQESLNNVAKHSQAKSLRVAFRVTPAFLRLHICDDGIGFDSKTPRAKRGLGLISMRERLHLIGGKLTITSKPGAGTRIEAVIPITKPTSAATLLKS